MAAVRAIEHCNTWTAPLAGHRWYGFIDEYLTDWYTLRAFAQRVVLDVFAAAHQYQPDHTPGAAPDRNSRRYGKDIILDGGWGTRIDSPKTIAHVAALRRIYANHWLARRLAESDDILSSVAARCTAFDGEQRRVDARVKRLTRSRNAAIHGGPLSDAACGTITEFATALAQQALNTTIWAIVTGQQVDTHATSRRDEYRQRILNLKQGRDLTNLFTLTPYPEAWLQRSTRSSPASTRRTSAPSSLSPNTAGRQQRRTRHCRGVLRLPGHVASPAATTAPATLRCGARHLRRLV